MCIRDRLKTKLIIDVVLVAEVLIQQLRRLTVARVLPGTSCATLASDSSPFLRGDQNKWLLKTATVDMAR